MRTRKVITIVATVGAAGALVGSAVAYANAGDDGDTAGAVEGGTAPAAATTATTAADDHTGHAGHAGHADHAGHAGHGGDDTRAGEDGGGRRARRAGPGGHAGGGHEHPELPPYGERYDAASAAERAAADDLRAEVTATLAAYADPDAAVAAGYRAPRRPGSARHHYLNRTLAADDDVLDPQHPEGLVYYQPEGGEPVLLGAFFVAPKGAEAPMPAGDIAVWHSHDPACEGFFATPEAPCTDSRRMLHVWTADTVTMTSPRDPSRTAEVDFVDPFGTPFTAAVDLPRR